jgi:predicted nuclease with TOPRIM domain
VTAPTDDRIRELREWAESMPHQDYAWSWRDNNKVADLLSLLDAYAALKEENATLRERIKSAQVEIDDLSRRLTDREAELEAARPLIEAAMGADTRTLRLDEQTIGETWAEGESGGTVILRAALAYRQRKEKGEGG